MITVRRFKTCYVQVFNPDGSFLCTADEHTFQDIRCQIKEQQVAGYTYSFNSQLGIINSNGECLNWFKGMFDLDNLFFSKLFKLRKNYDLDAVNKQIDERVDNSKLSNHLLMSDFNNDVHEIKQLDV